MFFQAQGHMDSQVQDNDKRTLSDGDVFAGFSTRLAQATEELQRIFQRYEQALTLSAVTALPATEAYRLICSHGLDFATTVIELLQDGYSITQALMIATRGAESGMLAMQRLAAQQRFSLSRFEAATQPKACRGCQHYYGHVDGMHRLICAMHPYGPEADDCEDWEAIAHHL